MRTTVCKHHESGRGNTTNRVAAVLLLAVAFLTTLGWTGESWGQAKLPRVGILTSSTITDDPSLAQWFEPFRRKLADEGWIEGKNLLFEYPSAQNDPSRIAGAAAELVALKVDVIWAPGAPYGRAAYAATRTIPIVAQDFTTDPNAEG